MTTPASITRDSFDRLLADHQELIRRANTLEHSLYCIGEAASAENVADCQQAAGTLIELLRNVLYRHDQQVLPHLESHLRDTSDSDRST